MRTLTLVPIVFAGMIWSCGGEDDESACDQVRECCTTLREANGLTDGGSVEMCTIEYNGECLVEEKPADCQQLLDSIAKCAESLPPECR